MIYDPFDDPTLEVGPEGSAAIGRSRPALGSGLKLPTLRLVTLPIEEPCTNEPGEEATKRTGREGTGDCHGRV